MKCINSSGNTSRSLMEYDDSLDISCSGVWVQEFARSSYRSLQTLCFGFQGY
ncbi:MAG: hypothetical protein HOB14_08130 [Gammaproteobacteria bacterium]|nr:hypothetical protein [Gammaproteobacteria bacterium]MBT3725170.1 hypothetical protein [Gammaproteobacteria bacterium]MBT4450466.1 hypothetical protein [Gammaproteobacteria bacterium]MBT4859422.1 hypothetical protein [Gammaproteobacteria bacterium]MBT6455514.1 hypothetical protein [Gammaproteobacteria bacterium]